MRTASCQRQPQWARGQGAPAARGGGGPREEVTHFDFANTGPAAQGQAAGLPAGFLQGGGVGPASVGGGVGLDAGGEADRGLALPAVAGLYHNGSREGGRGRPLSAEVRLRNGQGWLGEGPPGSLHKPVHL